MSILNQFKPILGISIPIWQDRMYFPPGEAIPEPCLPDRDARRLHISRNHSSRSGRLRVDFHAGN